MILPKLSNSNFRSAITNPFFINFSAIKSLGSLLNNLINEIKSLIIKGLVDIKISVNKNLLFKNDLIEIFDSIVSIFIILFL